MTSKRKTDLSNTLNESFESSSASGWLTARPSPSKEPIRKRKPVVSYEAFVSILFSALCILAVLDRFLWNTWPRQTYQIGRGSAGSDKMDGLKSGPWSVQLYDILARTSGRYAILAYNFLLLTRMESVEWLFTDTFVSKYFLDCTNIVNANIRMHRWNGIALCILTLLHVWSILFPCVFHGYEAKLVLGQFEWPLSERTPARCDYDNYEEGCWPGDTDPVRKTMGLQGDDVFRMVEMTLFLAVLMPISVRWLVTRWHAAIHLHRFIHVVYFVDIVRRHSHPHSWILNTPVFFFYYFDKWIFAFLHKRNNLPDIKRVKISQDFMALYWKSPFGKTDTVGPDYALRMHGTPIWEDKHVFTCFENRSGNAFNDDVAGDAWNVGVVIRVFRNPRVPPLGEAFSHTSRMYDEGEDKDNNHNNQGPKMLITGPRQGEMSEIIKYALFGKKQVILVGAGSAINYILDALQYCLESNMAPQHVVKVVYTTRDFELFQWVHHAISGLVKEMPFLSSSSWDITMAYTGQNKSPWKPEMDQTSSFNDNNNNESNSTGNTMQVVTGRVDFAEFISNSSVVFCQGSGSLKEAVQKTCQSHKKGAVFYGGLGGGS